MDAHNHVQSAESIIENLLPQCPSFKFSRATIQSLAEQAADGALEVLLNEELQVSEMKITF